jgi:DNA-binding NtrC family response regulator
MPCLDAERAHSVREATEWRTAEPTALIVVDDEPTIRCLVTRILETSGAKVHAFDTADAALDAIRCLGDIELVLSDVAMPGTLDGCGLARVLFALRPTVPVVLMSGDPEALAVARGCSEVRGFLAKPFAAEALLAAVGRGPQESRGSGT